MIVPFLPLLISLGGVAAAWRVPGLWDLILLAGPMAVASLWLLLRAWRTPRNRDRNLERVVDQPPARKWFSRPPKAVPQWIVIDGSNVMHWADETPRIEPLREVVAHLQGLGYTPGVVFDANAGYLLAGRYQHDRAFGRLLGLPQDRIMVVPKGEPADPTILRAAEDLDARVVTNDRYRDWVDEFPQVRQPGFLIRGGYREGKLWLDLDDAQPAQTRRVLAPSR